MGLPGKDKKSLTVIMGFLATLSQQILGCGLFKRVKDTNYVHYNAYFFIFSCSYLLCLIGNSALKRINRLNFVAMKNVLERIKMLKPEALEPNRLREVLQEIDFSQVDYEPFLEGFDTQEYNRITLLDAPLKVFITTWPSQYYLPAHRHNHFWGYITVLKGLLTETTFAFDADQNKLFCHPPKSFKKGELIFEPMNTTHHLQNPSPSKPLITLHFYFPAKYNYDGVLIFDIKNRRIAELNDKARRISWDLGAECYRRVEDSSFDVENLW